MLLIGQQILPISTIGNILRTVARMCMLMLGCKGLGESILYVHSSAEKNCFFFIVFKMKTFDCESISQVRSALFKSMAVSVEAEE